MLRLEHRSAFPARAVEPATRLAIGASLVIVTGLAWAWTAAMADMPSCHALPLGAFLVMWTVMMAAMMFPSVIPVVLAFAALVRPRTATPALATGLFLLGYLVVWSLLGVPAYAFAAAVPALGDGASLAAARPGLGGALLVACGVYQLTPLKDVCLRHCRMPHLFLGAHWRDGAGGALALGAHHGLYCAGCCASLMLVLLVVGMMDLAWMVGLSVVIYLEKLVPGGRAVGRIAGVALGATGLARIIG